MINTNELTYEEVLEDNGVTMDNKVLRLLDMAQAEQDRGAPWGVAMAHAVRLATELEETDND